MMKATSPASSPSTTRWKFFCRIISSEDCLGCSGNLLRKSNPIQHLVEPRIVVKRFESRIHFQHCQMRLSFSERSIKLSQGAVDVSESRKQHRDNVRGESPRSMLFFHGHRVEK